VRNPDQLTVDGKPYANPHPAADTGAPAKTAPAATSQSAPAAKGSDETM
jgi:hypothetical protein